jgi:hypothetical protein
MIVLVSGQWIAAGFGLIGLATIVGAWMPWRKRMLERRAVKQRLFDLCR